jgi:hypothetical protein
MKVVNLQRDILAGSNQEREARLRLAEETEKRLDAEREVNDILKANGAQVERNLRLLGMEQRGMVRITTLDGRREDVSAGRVRQVLDQPGRLSAEDARLHAEVRQTMVTREMETRALQSERAETGITDTVKTLMDQVRSGRGLSVGETMGALRGVSLGPIGVAMAAIAGLPRVIDGLERTFRSTVGVPLGQYQESRQLGMITGQGGREGFGMRAQAFRMGMNPFDLVSRQMALEIQRGLASEGFRGGVRDALSETVIGAVNDIGIDHAQAIQLVTEAYRNSNMTIQEIGRELRQFDDIARSTGRSVQDVAESMGALTGFAQQQGAGADASNIAAAILQSFPQQFQGAEIQQLISNEAVQGFAAARLGVMPQDLMAQPAEALTGALGESIDRFIAMAPGTDNQAKARWLNSPQSGSPFVGMGVDAIADFIAGGGGQAQFSRNLQLSQAQDMLGTRRRQMAEQTKEQESKGFFRRQWNQVFGPGTLFDPTSIDLDETLLGRGIGKLWINEREAAERQRASLPRDELIAMNQQALNAARGALTPQEIARFSKRIADPKFDLERELTARMGGTDAREQFGSAVTIGGVRIELNADAKKLLNLRGRNTDAVTRGQMPSNQSFYPGKSRTMDRSDP